MYGSHYSASTVSNITDVALDELEKWHNRPLKERYSDLFIDGTSIKVRRDHVDNESVYIIVGIDEEGYREILDFYIEPTESATLWEEVLEELIQDLKPIYKSPNLEFANQALDDFIAKWSNRYPKVTESWLENKDELLAFYKYPEPIRKSIYTTNWIERAIKEIKKQIKPKNNLPTIDAARKLVYLRVIDYNKSWSQRRMKGFLKAKEKLTQLFKERYQ